MPRIPTGAVHDADPNMRTIREGTSSLRSADIRSGIGPHSPRVPLRASSIIENCGGPAWVTGMGECGDKISDRTEQRPLLTFRSSARVAFRGSVNNELTGRRSWLGDHTPRFILAFAG